MDDSEDVKRIDEIIRKHKVEADDPDELEYAEFIDYTDCNEADDIIIEIDDYEIPEFPKSDLTQFHTYTPVHFLTDEEKRVVDSCPDPDLKQLLLLNRNKNIQLMQLYKKIKDLLAECQDNISTKQEFILAANSSKRVCNRIWRLGIPYFKSKDDFPCPRNEDIIRKHKNGELLFYDMTPSNKWAERDMNRLLKGIAFHYKVSKETELEKSIKKLEKEITRGVRDAEKEEYVQELKNDLEDLKNAQEDLYPPLGSDKSLDWNRIAECFLKDRYSAQDCQIFWNTYLHPDINKGSWTQEENEKLKRLAAEYKLHHWDMIAAELGNNRTGFITCVHYFCKIDPVRQGRFTEAEDKLLCDLVTHYKQGDYIPWTKIAHHFTDRTRGQIFYRYKYFLSCRSGKSKGKFTEAEDILILVLVDRFGKKFTKCGEYFPNRSVVQIKARYSSNLRGAIKKGSFTIEEDKEILEYVRENGTTSWEPLVKRLNRCGGQIRQRNKTLAAFVKAHPGADLEKAPRRRFCGLSFDAEYDFLRCMADKFKHCEKIPTLEDIQKLMIRNPKPKAGPLARLGKDKAAPRELRVREEPEHEEEESEKTPSEKNCKKTNRKTAPKDPLRISDEILSPPSQLEDGSDEDETFPEVSLSVDNLLVDFFSNTLKLNFQQSVRRQHIQRAAATVVSVLTTLQAELYIPANFADDLRLDSIDVDILKNLTSNRRFDRNREYVIGRDGLEIERLVPPNLYTLVGMRSLLIQNQIYKSRNSRRAYIFEDFKTECKEKQVQWCINNHLSNQSQNTQNILVSERNVFFKRFVSLFKFPAIMTLQKPSESLESGSKTWREENKGVRTYTMKKTRPALTEENKDNGKFESIFIKQQPRDDGYGGGGGASGSTSKINVGKLDYHSKRRTGTAPHVIDPLKIKAVNSTSDSAPKLSIVERLKRRINDTIDELSSSPPPKKFYKEMIPALPFRSVLKKTTTSVGGETGSERENSKPKRTYVSKNKPKPKPGINNISATFGDDQSKNQSARDNAVTIKTEILQDVSPDDSEAHHSSFNFSKGELVLENNSPGDSVNGSGSVNQDLLDLDVLNAVLKKERGVVEESFDF